MKTFLPLGVLVGTLAFGAAVACGSTGGSTFDEDGGASSGSSGDGTSSGVLGEAGSSGSGGDAGLEACATDKQEAKLAPLDLLVMQDTSGSMWGFTSGTTTKWESVKQALGSFMADPGSAGVGIGIQVFPKFEGGVATTCLTDAECGAGRTCALKGCSNQARICKVDGDCTGNGQCLDLGRCHDVGEALCLPGSTCVIQGQPAGLCDRSLVRGICTGVSTIACNAASYGSTVAPIAPLPGAAAAVNAALASYAPGGSTPTLGALTGAIETARAHANANPGRVVSVVLSTDGLPFTNGACDDAVASIAAAAAAGLSGSPSIKTFVIGVFAPAEATQATATLNQIAAAGGTGQASILGTSATTVQDFIQALQNIRGASLPCEVALPVPTTGTPDYAKVNVVYTDSATKNASIVGYVADAAACDPTKGGWYYDVKPENGAKPTKVLLCPATCATVQADPAGTLDVVQGCETKTQDPPR